MYIYTYVHRSMLCLIPTTTLIQIRFTRRNKLMVLIVDFQMRIISRIKPLTTSGTINVYLNEAITTEALDQ